ncbi:MCM DNA helicase complex subunit [Glugoides intestinalis]
MDASQALEKFKEFLDIHHEELASIKKKRIILDLNKLRLFNKDLCSFLLADPSSCIPWFEEEAKEIQLPSHIGFSGSFGANSHTPRSINSSLISKMLCIEGIVTSVSLVRPKLKKSVHYCEQEKLFYEKEYRDGTMITKNPPTNFIYPLKDANNHFLSSEFGLSEYIDFQTIQIQEMPENSPPGQLPRSIECILTEDLVDATKPGDRIRIYGIYKSFCYGNTQFPTLFRTVLIANNIEYLKALENVQLQELQGKVEMFNMLASSSMKFSAIAPTIFGHNDIKRALALMMVGGNEIQMKNGSRIRGDINILLIGDPSTAKSQLLRYALNFMPLSIATTGRGSTGVGLTAAVVIDKETGDKRLEAGAMVLADRGLVCIDEFDKMNPLDRIAIHEVMEQQTITIAKAGIHTTLNARCSVLAAANPVLGSYNERMSVQENIRLPESLLTRFDLIFITLDEHDSEKDDMISKHVLKMHISEEKNESEISQQLFKDFVMYAKTLRPVLSQEAADLLSREYVKIREKKDSKNLMINITPRMLETLIRLSTAYAKLRLSEVVELSDAEAAIELLNANLIRKTIRATHKKRVKVEEEEEQPTLGQLIRKELHEKIRDGIFEWKMANSDQQACGLVELSQAIGFENKEVVEVLKALSEAKHVHYSNETVFFLE